MALMNSFLRDPLAYMQKNDKELLELWPRNHKELGPYSKAPKMTGTELWNLFRYKIKICSI